MSKPDENNKKSASTQLAVGISVAFAVGLAVGAIVVWMIQLRSNRRAEGVESHWQGEYNKLRGEYNRCMRYDDMTTQFAGI